MTMGREERSRKTAEGKNRDETLRAHHIVTQHHLHSVTTVPSRPGHSSVSCTVMPHHVRIVGVGNVGALFRYDNPPEPHRRSAA